MNVRGLMAAMKVATVLIGMLLLTSCAPKHEYTGVLREGDTSAAEIEGLHGPDEVFSLADHRGEYVLVSFGYTTCPDVCPVTLSNLSAFYRALEQENAALAEKVTVIFVSVDPERDLPDVLKTYAQAFHPEFYGVHIADGETLESVKTAYGVESKKRVLPKAQSVMGYLIDHTAGTFVVDPDGNLRLYFSHNTAPDAILADILALNKDR